MTSAGPPAAFAAGDAGSPRDDAERSAARLRRMFGALSATHDAILRSHSAAEVCRRVAQAMVEDGGFKTAFVMLAVPGTPDAETVAAFGIDFDAARYMGTRTPLHAPPSEGEGLSGIAFRTRRPCYSNDYLNDPRASRWHAEARKGGTASAAALPLVRTDDVLGVLLVYSVERNAFDDEIASCLERIATSLALSLDKFEAERQRRVAEAALHETADRYRAVLETMNDGYFEVDLHGRLATCNDAMCSIIGAGRDRILGASFERFVTAETATRAREVARRLAAGEAVPGVQTWTVRREDGTEVILESSVQRVSDAAGKAVGFRGMSRDVTVRRRMEEALAASERRYSEILESIEDAYYEVDLAGTLTMANSSLCRMHGRSKDELIGLNNRAYMTPEMAQRVARTFAGLFASGEPARGFDWEIIRGDGGTVLVEGSASLVRDSRGRPVGFRGMMRDVTERRRMEQAMRESEARFRSLTELSSDWYWELDAGLRFTRLEGQRVEGVAGELAGTLLGRCRWETGLEPVDPPDWTLHRETLEARRSFRETVLRQRQPDGWHRYLSISGKPMHDPAGRFLGYRGVGQDVTDRKRAQDRIEYLATHDGLTGLPNRLMFSEILNRAIAVSERRERRFAVMFVDLDRFKLINDTLGHEAGDQLLKAMSVRFSAALRSSDVVARLGGDEFVVLLDEIALNDEALVVADKLLDLAMAPVTLCGRECRVTASIGISLYPDDALDEQSLMKNADIAMYAAKSDGKNSARLYSNGLESQSLERLTLESHLRLALERRELTLHYQAKVDLKTGAIIGVEALLRWHNPELGNVTPAQFIPLAEETGLIVPIGRWVLQTACEQNMAWQRAGLPPVCMAVNLSARQFVDDRLLADVADVLEATGMPARLLELEITEGFVVHDPQRAIEMLRRLKQMGVRLAIDDFGTGYSSLGQLRDFPIDTLKVDRSFIREIPSRPEDAAITQAIIAMGKKLSLTVVAEGVETREQEQFLRDYACDQMQGYYFSRPIAGDAFAELLRRNAMEVRALLL